MNQMIFCTNNVYAKVWKITLSEKYLDLQISTSEKDQEGNYINSSWFPRCIGHAFNALKGKLKEGDRITITKCKLSNERYTDKDGNKKSAFRFLILEASIDDNKKNETTSEVTSPAPQPEVAPATDDECPW